MKRILTIFATFLLFSSAFTAQAQLKGKILKLDFRTTIGERTGSTPSLSLSGVSNSSTLSLLSFEKALEKAAEDDNIGMIFMTPDNYSGGTAAAEEIRKALEKFRASGKPVVSYSTNFGTGSYYLASVADKVFMNPAGEGTFTGLSSQMLFYKDLLDSLGLNMQLIRHGKYKSAGEPYIRNDISPENREQYTVMLRSVWTSLMEDIAASRKTTVEALDALADNLTLRSAESWKENGLVDELAHRDEIEKYLCLTFGKKNANDVKYVTIDDYAQKADKASGSKKVAVVYANGEIGAGRDIDGTKLSRTLAKVRHDESIAAVVFRVNSPGGEVVASELIKREIQLLKAAKPVIASYGSYAASGGYLISSHCNRIFSNRTTLTGSIGVFGMIPSYGAALRKIVHINPVTVGTNAHSDGLSGVRDLDEKELAWHQASIESVYESFVSSVAESRGKTVEAVDSIAQGRVWAGRDAIGIGLVDEFGTLSDAIAYAAKEAGLGKNYGLATYPEHKSVTLKDLLSSKPEKEPLVAVETPAELRPVLRLLEDRKAVPVTYALPEAVIEIR
ncbi:MAG: signal peptide peptidase SppA [Bacteroidales bacterium]|nr:signal peptide peptidase SppA [Bacteroidales bacterium]